MPEKQTPGVSEERRCGSGKKTSKSFQTLQTSHHNNIIHNFGFAYIIYKYLYIYIYQIYNHICIHVSKNSQLLPVLPWSKMSWAMAPHFCEASAPFAAVSTDTVRKVCDSFRSLQPGSCTRADRTKGDPSIWPNWDSNGFFERGKILKLLDF